MRIDKYLWCIRVFKTRSIASEQVRGGKVLIDEQESKPSREIKVNDVITVKRHGYKQEFKVLGWPKSRVAAKLVADYVTEVTPAEEIEKKEFLQLAQNFNRARGTGRPTKKDRRDLDGFEL